MQEQGINALRLKGWHPMMWGYGFGAPGAGMTVWMILSSLFWLVIVGIAVWAFVRWLSMHGPASSQTPPTTASSPSALEILRQRYARGELDEPTFLRMQAQLTGSPADQAREAVLTSGYRSS
jgi:putative membrane protein